MKYKGQYTPSFLACPATYSWVSIEKCRDKLSAAKYCRLRVKPLAVDNYIGHTLLLHKRQVMAYSIFSVVCHNKAERKIREYAKLAGKDVPRRMLLFIE